MTDPLARFTRVTPPRTHVLRVLARSGPGAGPRRETPARRWLLLPVTAGLVVMAGAAVLFNRAAHDVAFMPPPVESSWGGKGVAVPVLPPRAYWEMSAIEEFERLRPHVASRDASPERVAIPRVPVPSWAAQNAGRPSTTAVEPAVAPIVIDELETQPVAIEVLAMPVPIVVAPVDIPPVMVSPLTEEEE